MPFRFSGSDECRKGEAVPMSSLRQLRLARGWSQRSLAARAGVSRTTVSQIERGASGAGPEVAGRLAAALGTDPRDVAELGRSARLRPARRSAPPSRPSVRPRPAADGAASVRRSRPE